MTATAHLSDEQLSAHLDSELGSKESAAASAHLFTCAECSSRLERLGATSEAIAALPETPLPRPLDMSFVSQPQRTGFWTRIFPARPPGWAYAAAGAAAVLVIAVAVVPRTLLNNSPNKSSVTALSHGASSAGGTGTTPIPGALLESRAQDQGKGAAPGAAFAPTSYSASRSFPNNGNARLTISTDVPSGRAGQPVRITVTATAGGEDLQLRSDGLLLYVAKDGTEHFVASTPVGGTLKAGTSATLNANWAAGGTPQSPAPGDYTLVGRLALADGTNLDVSLSFHVS